MNKKQEFKEPILAEYGRLSEIVAMPHEGDEPHKDTLPPGLEGRLDDPCNDGVGPKQAAKADANWTCGSS